MSRLDPRLLLQGYATGIFPMADSRHAADLFWVEPRNRAIIPLSHFHLSHSLRRTLRSGKFQVTLDRAFAAVITNCADREETWINAELEQAMLAEAGRKFEDVPITLMGGGEDVDLLKRYRDMGVVRWVAMLPAEGADATLPRLDRWAAIMRQVNS